MASILDHFDALTGRGLKIIPLRENSKAPLCKGWTENWDRAKAREKLEQLPDANIGLLLGEIIDVEGDSEEGNQIVTDLIGDYPHPFYRSTKSIHHLFLSPDQQLRHFRWNTIEFRGYGHQSVLPPSHHAGVQYCWMEKFHFPVPEMPQKLLAFYLSKQQKSKTFIKKDHIRVWCGTCSTRCFLHKKRFALELEVFKLLGSKWTCQNCRAVDIRHACRLFKIGLDNQDILAAIS